MLTKKEVSAFLDRMEEQAFKTVKESYADAVKAEEQRIFELTKAPEIVEGMQQLMDELVKRNENLNEELKRSSGIKYCDDAYHGMSYYLSRIQSISDVVLECVMFESKKLGRLRSDYFETRRKITANYAAIRAELKNKSKATQCVEYLREVGFDVSELEKPKCTELAVALDKRYLFIGIKKEEM